MASICEYMIYIEFGWMCVTQVMFTSSPLHWASRVNRIFILGEIRQMAMFLQSSNNLDF